MANQPDVLQVLAEHSSPRNIPRRYTFNRSQRPSAVIGPRAGIYILEFGGRDAYVGQAKNVVRRLKQHANSSTHHSFLSFCFLPVPQNRLSDVERSVIAGCEQMGYQLRNHVFASFNYKPSELDNVVSAEFLDEFASGGENRLAGLRPDLPELRLKHRARFEELQKHPGYPSLTEALRAYIASCVPAPISTELGYWSISCLPKRRSVRLLACLNVHWQEVLFIVEEPGGQIWVTLNIAATPLIASGRITSGDLVETNYVPGGADQDQWEVPLHEFGEILSAPDMVEAARVLNVRLMRKGRCNFSRSHCFDLADAIMPAPLS